MARYRPNAPPSRHGVGPSCVVLPPEGPWPTVLDFLITRFPGIDAIQWQQRMLAGDVIDEHGQLLAPPSPYVPKLHVYYFRALEAQVLWQDAHLLVVDKPHFLPVMPSGKYLQETVLVRLKNALGLDDLTPIHRIDRDTAGLVLFSVSRSTRDAYHALFRERTVTKTYECVAPSSTAHAWPMHRESRMVVAEHFMQMTEVPAEVGSPVNAITDIALLETQGPWSRYQLKPLTGQRHQLRLHMAALGLPIRHDGMYPTLTPEGACNTAQPLQLLAKKIAFTDPLSGEHRTFSSQRSLLPLD
jgi:tRNA pseudouridine32 synthase / 23S rRNA pseudouridine746 synthase